VAGTHRGGLNFAGKEVVMIYSRRTDLAAVQGRQGAKAWLQGAHGLL
jgi:hypothetical protein